MSSGANLGKAYVQIVPTTKGIKSNIENELSGSMKSAGDNSGKIFGGNLVSTITKALAVAGIGKVIKDSLFAGGALQQSLGGIETLFKGSADKMKKFARESYKTVGVSANEYMENVTSFSASLISSLGGDTERASKIANMAMIDMGDNANKMGTNMQDIQNAYQGFAKGNYTMLDNLKLGFGGTKTEMQRLLKEATKFSGVKYNIDNLGDVYEAIHVIQKEIGITGTTAKEANETLTGSLSAMTASFQNLIGNIAIGNGTIKQDMMALGQTIGTFVFGNLLPMLGNIISAIPPLIIEFITVALPQMIQAGSSLISFISQGVTTGLPNFLFNFSTFIQNILLKITEALPSFLDGAVQWISSMVDGILSQVPAFITIIGNLINEGLKFIMDNYPEFLSKGVDLILNIIDGIIKSIPNIVSSILKVMQNLLKTIQEKFPEYVRKGIEIIVKLASGLLDRLPYIISTLGNIIGQLLSFIGKNLPKFLATGLKILGELGIGLIRALPGLLGKIPGILKAILGVFKQLPGMLFNVGKDLITGLWNGIKSVGSWIKDQIGGFVDGIVGGIKSFFGINSPSRLMADEVGKFLPMGLAVGIENNLKPVSKAMDEMGEIATREFNSDISFGTNLLNKAKAYATSGMVSMKDELQVEANIDVNLGGHDLTRITQILGKEKDKQDEFEYAY